MVQLQNHLKRYIQRCLALPYIEGIGAFENRFKFLALRANQFQPFLFSFYFSLQTFIIFSISLVKIGCLNVLSLLGPILVNGTVLENSPFHLSFHLFSRSWAEWSIMVFNNSCSAACNLLPESICMHVLYPFLPDNKRLLSCVIFFPKDQDFDLLVLYSFFYFLPH